MLFLSLLICIFQDSYLIKSIDIRGNEETVDYVIRREILFSEGDHVTKADIVKSQKRIESLFIFNSVSYELEKDSDAYQLIYEVSEKLNFFVIPIVKLTDDKLDRLTYGLAFNHSNLLGRKYFLSFQTLFGDRSGFRLRFSDPWFLGKWRLFYSITLENIKNSNIKNIDILNQTHLADITIGKGFGPYFRVAINTEYQKTFFNAEDRAYSISNSTSDKQITYGFSMVYDNRDFFLYPKKGF
ncbi:MAG: BamA/TamA family outer membrane protein, partial [Calditrichaeota bacterium]|nr:BamA/TamA family outer membrane protein [Calditrichota bacterium]